MTERSGDFLLRGQLRLADADRHQPQMNPVLQGDAVKGLMPTEYHTVSIGIDKPHRGIEKRAVLDRNVLEGQGKLGGGVRVHTSMDASRHETFPEKPSCFPTRLRGEELRQTCGITGLCQEV